MATTLATAPAASTAARPAPPVPLVDVIVGLRSILGEYWGQVVSIETEDDLNLPGSFSVEVLQSAVASSPSSWLQDDRQFALGSTVEIQLGYTDRASVMTGEITTLEPRFEATGQPRLTVRGYDVRHRLQRGSRTRSFQNVSDSDVATQIVRDAGIRMQAEASRITHEYLMQVNQNDLDFLNTRAEAIGYELLRLQGGGLSFAPSAFGAAASATIQYGGEVRELHFSLTAATQPTALNLRAWSVADKTALIGKAAAGSESSLMGGKNSASSQASRDLGAAEATVVTQPAVTQAEVDAMATARFAQAGLEFLSVEGLCTGRNDLRVGMVVEIKGVGPRYGGLYHLDSVKHRYSPDSGYETRFHGRRNSV